MNTAACFQMKWWRERMGKQKYGIAQELILCFASVLKGARLRGRNMEKRGKGTLCAHTQQTRKGNIMAKQGFYC